MKMTDKIGLYALLVSICAFVLALFSTIMTCSSEKELKKTNYELASLNYRPKLKLSDPMITWIKLSTDSLPMKNVNNKDTIGSVAARISLGIRVKITNIGNNSAKLAGYALSDTISEERIIRKYLNDESRQVTNDQKGDTIKIAHIYKDLAPLDFMSIEIGYSPRFIVNNQFVIHILLLYENELGQLFDTYYWLKYKTNPVTVPNPLIYANNKAAYERLKNELVKSVDFEDENNFSSIYSEKERLETLGLDK